MALSFCCFDGWPAQDGAHKLPGHYISQVVLWCFSHGLVVLVALFLCFLFCLLVFLFLFVCAVSLCLVVASVFHVEWHHATWHHVFKAVPSPGAPSGKRLPSPWCMELQETASQLKSSNRRPYAWHYYRNQWRQPRWLAYADRVASANRWSCATVLRSPLLNHTGYAGPAERLRSEQKFSRD